MGRPDKRRRWRVSVYAPGVTDPASFPMVHKASRRLEIAQAHFDRYAAQIATGKVGRVVLHQGKLYTGYSRYIHEDTAWNLYKYQAATSPGRGEEGK